MAETAKAALEVAQSVITALLSWIFLAAISIIISGKLISIRLPIGIKDEAFFEIPLGIFKLRASGEEVSTGFIAFILSLTICIFLGGAPAYIFFRTQSGVDIGQWNSLCLLASFLSLIFSTSICAFVPLFKSAPVLSQSDRDETLRILERKQKNDRAI